MNQGKSGGFRVPPDFSLLRVSISFASMGHVCIMGLMDSAANNEALMNSLDHLSDSIFRAQAAGDDAAAMVAEMGDLLENNQGCVAYDEWLQVWDRYHSRCCGYSLEED